MGPWENIVKKLLFRMPLKCISEQVFDFGTNDFFNVISTEITNYGTMRNRFKPFYKMPLKCKSYQVFDYPSIKQMGANGNIENAEITKLIT